MPSRLSDRGNALARGIRTLGTAPLEFTEPYGTISAAKDIYEDPSNPWPYLFAMPVIGDAAKFAKGKKLAELLRKNKNLPKTIQVDVSQGWLDKPLHQPDKISKPDDILASTKEKGFFPGSSSDKTQGMLPEDIADVQRGAKEEIRTTAYEILQELRADDLDAQVKKLKTLKEEWPELYDIVMSMWLDK